MSSTHAPEMAARLSVNLNKVALLRNSRHNVIPDPVRAASLCIGAGAHGITVHPRPDKRHIRPDDVYRLSDFLGAHHPQIEYNIEGNPFAGPEANGYPGFMELVRATRPAQATLVPDSPDQLTSDHGWQMSRLDCEQLAPVISELVSLGVRVSLFVDEAISSEHLEAIAQLGAARVELYTGPYAEAYDTPHQQEWIARYAETARRASAAGLAINAGHDLNTDNLTDFLRHVPGVQEVSIGHALIADALEYGLSGTITRYLDAIRAAS